MLAEISIALHIEDSYIVRMVTVISCSIIVDLAHFLNTIIIELKFITTGMYKAMDSLKNTCWDWIVTALDGLNTLCIQWATEKKREAR